MATLRVYETFLSLQGESTFAGRLCYFIRLAGCNLRCSYCDTGVAQPFDAGSDVEIEELVRRAVASGSPLVEVTGGEPLAQPGTPVLLTALLDEGLEVLLETNGAVAVDQVPEGVHRIIDYKLPSSGMAERMLAANFQALTPDDEVKFVIGGRADYDFAKKVIVEYDLASQTPNLLYSPVWGSVGFEELASWVIEDRLPGRMQIQMHKIIWGPERAGV